MLGFSLEDIAELLKLAEAGHSRTRIKVIAQRCAADLENRIHEMEEIHDTLVSHVRLCSGRGAIRGCPIIKALAKELTL